MQSFIITAKDKEARERITATLFGEHEIHRLDVTIVESEKSIGIEDVRNMQKTVFLKPLRGSKKAVVIKNAHTATIQAQNALLKLLEEPPANALMILTASKKEFLLPTILSRCSVIEEVSKEQKEAHGQLHHPILTVPSSSAKGLHLAQEAGKTREDALAFLEEAITATHTALLNISLGSTTLPAKVRDLPPRDNSQTLGSSSLSSSSLSLRVEDLGVEDLSPSTVSLSAVSSGSKDSGPNGSGRRLSTLNVSHLLRKLQQTHTIIATTNVSPRLALEHLLLNL